MKKKTKDKRIRELQRGYWGEPIKGRWYEAGDQIDEDGKMGQIGKMNIGERMNTSLVFFLHERDLASWGGSRVCA